MRNNDIRQGNQPLNIVYSKRIISDYPIWQTAFANSSKSNSENTVDQIQQIEEETINDNHKGL